MHGWIGDGRWEVAGPRSLAELREAATHYERVAALHPAPALCNNYRTLLLPSCEQAPSAECLPYRPSQEFCTDFSTMASAAMSTYYPMIYDFLVEQARTTNTNQPTRHPAPPPSHT